MTLENLARRELLASDLAVCYLDQPVGQPAALLAETVAEGEPARDLVAFAKQLTEAGAVLYGAGWSAETTEQLAAFGDGARYLTYVEAADADHLINQAGLDAAITQLPTWIFPDESRATGVLTPDEVATSAGIFIPAGAAPSFFPIDDLTVGIGSPLFVPIDGYDPNGDALSITVTSSDPSLLQVSVNDTNASVRFSVADFGEMVFELFEDRVPDAAGRVIELVDSGFYDDLDIHRIAPDRLIQFGDHGGTGTGGSPLGPLDDQYHADLQYNRDGVLGFAKVDDDSGDSQLFVTAGAQRRLDFLYPVVGQLVEGQNVRNAINAVPVNAFESVDASYLNAFGPVTITSAEIFNDTQNRLLMLKPTGAGTGPVNVEVTITDPEGNQSQQTFLVSVTADDFQADNNAAPFLNPIAPPHVAAGEQLVLQLSATDIENDAVAFDAYRLGDVPYEFAIDPQTGQLSVSPPSGFVGELEILVGVRRAETPAAESPDSLLSDLQRLVVSVDSTADLMLNLDTASDTGVSNTDNLTSATSPSFTVTGTEPGATVELMIGEDVIGSTVAEGASVSFGGVDLSGQADGEVSLQVRQTFDTVVTTLESPLVITLDRIVPSQSNQVLNAGALATRPFLLDIDHAEEGNGLVYSLITAPTGMTLDPATGRLQWTPGSTDVGTQAVDIRYTDLAGNTFDETLSIDVAGTPQAIFHLGATDIAGTPIDQVVVGDEFLITVHVADNRQFTSRHVFSAYLDLIFDSSHAVPVGGDAIEFGPTFNFSIDGSISGNLVDELGGVADVFDIRNALVATIRMQAVAPGLFTAVGSAPEGIGHELLMVDSPIPVPVEAIDFGRVEIVVGKQPQPMQVDFSSSIVADPARDNVSNLTITTDTTGLVDIWADFNRNGSFNDPGELIVSDFSIANQTAMVPFTIPAGMLPGDIDVVFGISADGNLSLSDGDRLSGIPVVDGATASPFVVHLDGQTIAFTASPDGELLVEQDGVTLFRAAGASSLALVHGDGDSQWTIGDLSSTLPGDAALAISAGGGIDTLTTAGLDRALDLSGSEHLFSGIEAIAIEDASQLTLDLGGFTKLGPNDDRLDITIPDLDALRLLGQWEIESTETLAAGLLRNLISGDATIGLMGGHFWTNPSDPLDVNGSGTVEPIDALNILNELTLRRFIDHQTNALPELATLTAFPGRFYDTNRDGRLTPIDALRIINRLSIISLAGEQFSQPTDAAAFAVPPTLAIDHSGRDDEDDELEAQQVDAYFS
ncbi:peptidylprolyl isomerase [Rosistilla ulvae]|uniref:peptidylprolyl isomerase n=1 Tax=Rosistilla ulvae TaxID=1930277 RepID=UPI001C54EA09|nr:peptidylprolyl isomerase [Rosistilla ulvae]